MFPVTLTQCEIVGNVTKKKTAPKGNMASVDYSVFRVKKVYFDLGAMKTVFLQCIYYSGTEGTERSIAYNRFLEKAQEGAMFNLSCDETRYMSPLKDKNGEQVMHKGLPVSVEKINYTVNGWELSYKPESKKDKPEVQNALGGDFGE